MDQMFGKTVLKDGIYLCSEAFAMAEEQKKKKKQGEEEEEEEKVFVRKFLAKIDKQLEKEGDRDVLVNAELAVSDRPSNRRGLRSLRLSSLSRLSRKTSLLLHNLLSVRPGDVVYIFLGGTTEYFYPVVGSWLCNASVTMSDPMLGESTFTQRLEEIEPKVIFCHEENREMVERIRKSEETAIVVVDFYRNKNDNNDKSKRIYDFYSLLDNDDFEFPAIPDSVFDGYESSTTISAIFWSAGTTGRPKGIPHTFDLFTIFDSESYKILDKFLQSTCFFHISGFTSALSVIYNGGTAFFYPYEGLEANPGLKLLRACCKLAPYILIGGSHHVMEMVRTEITEEEKAPELLLIFPMGTTITVNIYEVLKNLFFPNLMAVGNLYGSTEFGVAISMSSDNTNLGNVTSVTKVKIVDPLTNKICGVNEIGEMRGKCKQMCKGYLNRPEETKDLFDEEGFMRFGDLGHFDENFVLHYDGRLKELIKYKNWHLYPEEIEGIITEHPMVADAAVFGRPDPLSQELVTAVVVTKGLVTEEEIVAMVEKRVDDHKRIRGGVFFVENLERNHQGKLVGRKELVKLVEKMLLKNKSKE